MLAMVLALALQVPPAPLVASEVARARTQPPALAPQVLPPETSALIEGGEVWRVWIPGEMYQAQFWEAPQSGPDGFCKRRIHMIEFGKPQVPGEPAHTPETLLALKDLGTGYQYAPAWPRPTTAETCDRVQGFISLRPETKEAQLRMLGRLTDAMAQAEAGGPLPFEILCTDGDTAVCENPRATLAALPLNILFGVRLTTGQAPGVPDPKAVRAQFLQRITDGRWPEAVIEFGRSDIEGRSWIVTLKGVDGLESVEMRRTTIIRH